MFTVDVKQQCNNTDQFILKNEFIVHVIGLRVNGLLEEVYVYTLLVDSMQLLMTYVHKSSLDVHVPVQIKEYDADVKICLNGVNEVI